jgi:dTDP-4-amino-4,6-dideoxygalactose transaminase
LDSDQQGLRDELSRISDREKDSQYDLLSCAGHRQKMFETFGGLEYDLPVTDWLTERIISLPMTSLN